MLPRQYILRPTGDKSTTTRRVVHPGTVPHQIIYFYIQNLNIQKEKSSPMLPRRYIYRLTGDKSVTGPLRSAYQI